ncbi:MAG: hypothetical protein ACKVOM_04510, partial [Ferruginibacter sp.]
HLQGTQSPHTKANPAESGTKSLPCANAQATLCGWTQTHIIDDHEEGRTYKRGFAKIRADGSYLRLFVILLCFISSLT